MSKIKIVVRGPFLTRSGYGRQARHALQSLRAYEEFFDIYAIPLKWGNCGWIFEENEERQWMDSLIVKTQQFQNDNPNEKFDVSIQVTIPLEGEVQNLAHNNILYTSGIETTKISGDWVTVSNEMDKIITISQAAAHPLKNTSYEAKNEATGEVVPDYKINIPIEVVHYPVRNIKPKKVNLNLTTSFNFLVVAQWGVRKNIENTVRWFIEEFIDNKDVGLILKMNMSGNSIMDKELVQRKLKNLLSEYPQRECAIYLLHGDMTNEEMTGLYRHKDIKALVSLAHGESWGLPIMEAAYNNLPIVTHAWGGPADYMFMPVVKKTGKTKNRAFFAKIDYDLNNVQKEAVWDKVIVPESMWAYPKQGSYKMKLREVYKNHDRYVSQSKKLSAHLKVFLDEKAKHKQFVEAVLGHEVKKVSANDIPKISLITSVFNGAEFIENFFKDLERQTIWDKCELILIHPRTSLDFVKEAEIILKKREDWGNSKIKYKSLKEDPGVYGCWTEAVKMAKGEFITNCNLDDRKAKDSLEKHAKFLLMHDDVDLVYSDNLLTHTPNETWEKNTSEQRYTMEQFSKEAMMRFNLPHSSPLWKKSLHDKFGYFNNEYMSAGDWEFFLRCTFGGAKFKKMDDVLNLYYFNPKGLSTNKETDEKKRKEELGVYKKYQGIMIEELKKNSEFKGD